MVTPTKGNPNNITVQYKVLTIISKYLMFCRNSLFISFQKYHEITFFSPKSCHRKIKLSLQISGVTIPLKLCIYLANVGCCQVKSTLFE